jgi:hypothetical protein
LPSRLLKLADGSASHLPLMINPSLLCGNLRTSVLSPPGGLTAKEYIALCGVSTRY